MLSELRLVGVNSDAVSTTAPDLAPIVGAYEAELTEKRYCDLARLLALADEALQKRLHRFAGMPIALLDVPLRNRGELQLISTIASAAPAMLVTIPASDTESAAKLRDSLGVPYDDLDGTPAQGEKASTIVRAAPYRPNEQRVIREYPPRAAFPSTAARRPRVPQNPAGCVACRGRTRAGILWS